MESSLFDVPADVVRLMRCRPMVEDAAWQVDHLAPASLTRHRNFPTAYFGSLEHSIRSHERVAGEEAADVLEFAHAGDRIADAPGRPGSK
jgi:hypothetical protein